ncbi:MAG: VOC family protein [Caulobacterales bacterium]
MPSLIVNIDTPSVDEAEAFYAAAFGFTPVRRLFGGAIAEMRFAGQIFHVHEAIAGAAAFDAGEPRRYTRHWTPLHLDIVVDALEEALAQAVKAGAVLERPIAAHDWGRIAGSAIRSVTDFALSN